MHVAVVGGGVIGLCTAYSLARRGTRVTVVDKGRVGGGCSHANGGWICPSIADPLPSPAIRANSLGMLLRSDSPLYVRPASLPLLASWLTRFWKYCTSAHYERGVRALGDLAVGTMDSYDRLAGDGVEFEMGKAGILMLARSRARLEEKVGSLRARGYGPIQVLEGPALQELEPAVPEHFAGGVWVQPERHVRPDTLCAGLTTWLRRGQATVTEDFEVIGAEIEGTTMRSLRSARGSLEADAFVFATGADPRAIEKTCGIALPLQAGKGYSITLEEARLSVRRPLYLVAEKIVITPFQGALRIGGTMELSGVNVRMDRRRLTAMARAAERGIPGILDGGSRTEWVGMRPLTPDGLPLLGPLPGRSNVFVATGHQMLGVTLAPRTGEVMTDLILEGRTDVDVEPFDPRRFTS
jgi:D-amino-acid dehydrogenase